jgi:hypothetical protein
MTEEQLCELERLVADVWTPPFVGADAIVASVDPRLAPYVLVACNAVPALVADVRRLRAERDECRMNLFELRHTLHDTYAARDDALAEVRRLRALDADWQERYTALLDEAQGLRDALAWYADADNYSTLSDENHIDGDCGARARAALEGER